METPGDFRGDFQRLVENSRDMISIHDPPGRYVYVNPASREITGYEPSELIGREPYQFFHPDDREAISSESHEPAKLGDDTVRIRYRFCHKDGNYIWLDTLTRPITDDEDRVIRLHATSRDVTESVLREQELDEQRKLLQMGQKLSGLGSWEVNLSDFSVVWNEGIRRIHDIEDDRKLTVEDVLNFYVGESKKIAEDRLQELLADSPRFDERLMVRTLKGREIWVRVIGEVQYVAGKPAKVYGICQDVDKQYRHQRELQQMVDRLSRRRKQVTDISRMLGHNIKGTIGNINMLMGIITETTDAKIHGMLKKNIDMVFETLDSMAELIKDVDAVADPNAVAHVPSSYNKAVEGLIPAIREVGGELSADFSGIENIKYPALYLESIFYNFISNAVKYRDHDKTLKIVVTLAVDSQSLVLIFADNGLGIDLARFGSRLFGLNQRFHTASQGFDREIEGSGIGLFLCKRQIESLGGEISVESAVGQGTAFTIRLGSAEELVVAG